MDIRKNYIKQCRKKKNKKLSIRRKIKLGSNRLRLTVYKSCKNLYAQIINDKEQNTLCSSSTMEKGFNDNNIYRCNKKNAQIIGSNLAERALKKNITYVVFDRNSYPYHGIIQILADSCREKGLRF